MAYTKQSKKTQTKKLNTLARSLVSALINTAAGGGAIVFAPERTCNLFNIPSCLVARRTLERRQHIFQFPSPPRAVAAGARSTPSACRREGPAPQRPRHFSSDSASPRYHPFTPASTLALYAYVWINRRVINQRR
jgi:hypothetical protein